MGTKRYVIVLTLIFAAIFSSAALFAQPRDKSGGIGTGGGDLACEARVQFIRDNIRAWIHAGGHTRADKPLIFASGEKVEDYSKNMAEYLSVKRTADGGAEPTVKIKCSRDGVKVEDVDKICRFKRDGNDLEIKCDTDALSALKEDLQYRQIHHEYAQLAGFELPAGSQSQYYLSEQVSARLEVQQLLMLPILPPVQKTTKYSDDDVLMTFHGSSITAGSLRNFLEWRLGVRRARDKGVVQIEGLRRNFYSFTVSPIVDTVGVLFGYSVFERTIDFKIVLESGESHDVQCAMTLYPSCGTFNVSSCSSSGLHIRSMEREDLFLVSDWKALGPIGGSIPVECL